VDAGMEVGGGERGGAVGQDETPGGPLAARFILCEPWMEEGSVVDGRSGFPGE
jgi:hypothetical protein